MHVQMMRNNIKAILPAALAIFVLLAQGCALLHTGQSTTAPLAPDTVLVTVNGEPIRQSDVDRQVAELTRMIREANPTLTDLELARRHNQLVNDAREQLIDNKLVDQAIAKANVKVDDARIDAKIRSLGEDLQREGLSLEGLKQALNVTPERFREMIRTQLVGEVFWQQRLGLKPPAEDELRKTYEKNQKLFMTPPAVHLYEVFVPLPEGRRPTRQERDNQRTTAQALRARLTAGENFATVARDAAGLKAAREKAGNATDESDLGWVTPMAPLPRNLLQVAFTLKPGQLSDVVETPEGFHIVKVTERLEPRQAPFEKIHDQLAAQMVRGERDRRIPEELKKMRKEAKIEWKVKH